MAIDAYLKVDGIRGESTDKDHMFWIELVSFLLPQQMWGVSHSDLEVTKFIDSTTPNLLEACCKGTHHKTVILELVRVGGATRYVFEDVGIDTVQPVPPPHDVTAFPCERIRLKYGRCTESLR